MECLVSVKQVREVWLDEQHSNKMFVHVLTFEQREQIKYLYKIEPKYYYALICYSHWHRFLESLDKQVVGPCFASYIEWKRQYPGWTCGSLTRGHSAWKEEYSNHSLGMNRYYGVE